MDTVTASMQSWLWYDHFRGALYPHDLDEIRSATPPSGRLKTLVQLTANFIVKDSTFTLAAVRVLPQELLVPLMQEALTNHRDTAVSVLLTYWPELVFCLKSLAPNIYNNLCRLHDNSQVIKDTKLGLQYTTGIAHTFLQTIKTKCKTKLKILDMTDFPTAEIITYYLSSHCLLAHNEVKQKLMIEKYEAITPAAQDSANFLEKIGVDLSLPGNPFAIKFDAFVTSDHTVSEFCKALLVSSFDDSTARLIVEKLDVTCLGEPKTRIILQHLNPQHLKGLRMKYNSLSGDQFIHLAPLMETFTNITALDLSCNAIQTYQNERACDSMCQLLGNLQHLVRLDLSNNRIKSRLRRTLANIPKPLQYLRLVGCGLNIDDMSYLSQSHHTTGITELDISENSLGQCITEVIRLLLALTPRLQVLELEDTLMTDNVIDALLASCVLEQLTALLYVNLAHNCMSQTVLCRVCQSVAQLPDVRYLCVSYSRECYYLATYDDQSERCKAKLADVIYKERHQRHLELSIPCLVMSDLEPEM